MISLSIALIVVACIAGYLGNRWLDQAALESLRIHQVNTATPTNVDAEVQAQLESCLSEIQSLKNEFNSLRLQIGLKGIK